MVNAAGLHSQGPLKLGQRPLVGCFTTEILEGFDVQRTNGITDTVKKYGYLTQSISLYYMTQFSREAESMQLCPTFDEFVKTCQDLEKMIVTDVFALQLMQVPQVTEEIALAVVKMYPTLVMLARAYSVLVMYEKIEETIGHLLYFSGVGVLWKVVGRCFHITDEMPNVTRDFMCVGGLAEVQWELPSEDEVREGAYEMLKDGDICAQEEMLKNKSNLITGAASRNIFKLVWGGQ
ncbi:hypothetical protein Taro_018690 [Colocasia esculenta]|uniref:Crossover junction endonuclease MUS81 n=1 Tax=Colocasia esculenta TaxID=4460 RepID=A0A843UWY9_COLES|nr:hypothetical protein [Colocasia esculenta]